MQLVRACALALVADGLADDEVARRLDLDVEALHRWLHAPAASFVSPPMRELVRRAARLAASGRTVPQIARRLGVDPVQAGVLLRVVCARRGGRPSAAIPAGTRG